MYPKWSEILSCSNADKFKEWFLSLPSYEPDSAEELKWVYISNMYYLGEEEL